MNLIFVGKLIARCKSLGDTSKVALASVAESLLGLKNVLLEDVARYKKAKFKSIEAKVAAEEAEAQKKLTEAAQAANKVTDETYEKAVQNFELQAKEIRNRKLAADAAAAEARADKSKADAAKAKAKALESMIEVCEEVRQRNIEAAEKNLIDVLRQYTFEGGQLLINSDNLKELLKLKEKNDSENNPPPPAASGPD